MSPNAQRVGIEDGRVPTLIRTLAGAGFLLDGTIRKHHYLLIECHRFDEFGNSVPYVFALAEERLSATDVNAISGNAARRHMHAIVIGEVDSDALPCQSWQAFVARFGGPIKSWLPLEPDFALSLELLGHNQPIPGIEGQPDDLFEEYAHAALQFMLHDRVIRYGQNRRGEKLPDGAVVARNKLNVLYDAKAYPKGYDISANSIRQFESYVGDFHTRYENYLGRVYAFLVVSGEYKNGATSIQRRSQELYTRCGVTLATITSSELGRVTQLLVNRPSLRVAIDWRKILSVPIITSSAVEREITAIDKDGVVK